MTPKYSTGDDTRTNTWDSDREYVLHEWTDRPFVGHRKRHRTVEHRIRVEYHHEVGADIHHEVRSDDTNQVPDEWAALETLEVREWGCRHDRHTELRWFS